MKNTCNDISNVKISIDAHMLASLNLEVNDIKQELWLQEKTIRSFSPVQKIPLKEFSCNEVDKAKVICRCPRACSGRFTVINKKSCIKKYFKNLYICMDYI